MSGEGGREGGRREGWGSLGLDNAKLVAKWWLLGDLLACIHQHTIFE